jgi:hypothetical protein
MKETTLRFHRLSVANLSAALLCLIVALGTPTEARGDAADARRLLKAMSDYLAGQQAIALQYDTVLEIVTKDRQKLGLASSGKTTINRPDRIHTTRNGGFEDVEFLFDGKTLTVLGKRENRYGQLEVPGTIDHLVDALRNMGRSFPGADLLSSDVYSKLMAAVVDVKDLGDAVIGGLTCDHLAFRTPEVDWQIWIAQGGRPYPCRYVITSTKVDQAPQYSITIRDWKTGEAVGPHDFSFKNATGAKKFDLAELPNIDELPGIFAVGGVQ